METVSRFDDFVVLHVFNSTAEEYGIVVWNEGGIDIVPETMYDSSYVYNEISAARFPLTRKAGIFCILMEVVERNLQLLERMNRIFSRAGLSKLIGETRTGGSDAAYVTERGIPCIDSMGVVGGNLHSRDEYAYIHSLIETAKRLAAMICMWDQVRK